MTGCLAKAKRPRTAIRCIVLLVALVFALPAFTSLSVDAVAQEYKKEQKRGLLDLLFGGPAKQKAEKKPVRKKRVAPRRTKRAVRQGPKTTRSSVVHRAPAAALETSSRENPVEKREDARVVLVVGDFLASGLAEGLESAFEQSPGIRIVDRSNGSSGFVRDDFYDWNSEITAILEELRPAAVVAMIGSNDRQPLIVDGRRESVRSEAWMREYTARVDRFAASIRSQGIPLVWTGLPSFKLSSMSSDMLAFNDVYKNAVEKTEGTFVDIWDGFVDETGNFIFSGPDMNGQPVRLRGKDGINLTKAAKRKVAFFVEKPLNKAIGSGVARSPGDSGTDAIPQSFGPDPAKPSMQPDRTPPLALTDPTLDGGGELMGKVVRPISTATVPIPAEDLNRQDTDQAARPGRADNFQ